jgi:hypothetical protein
MSKPNHHVAIQVFGQTFHLFAEAAVVQSLEAAMRQDANAESYVSSIAFMGVEGAGAADRGMTFRFRPPARLAKRSVLHVAPPKILRAN